MNIWHKHGIRWGLTVFGIAMAGLAAWAYWRFGATLLAAVAVAISIGCLAALLYVWWLSRRSLAELDAARGAPGAPAKRRQTP